jgi:hypothetical protein
VPSLACRYDSAGSRAKTPIYLLEYAVVSDGMTLLRANDPPPGVVLPLATRKGRQIPNERPKPAHRDVLLAAEQMLNRPGRTWRRSDSTYNCLGLVFGSRRTWIEPEHFAMITNDDGYRQVLAPEAVQVGDIAVWFDHVEVLHVGLVVESKANIETATFDVTVLSKFGRDGEYLHSAEDLPDVMKYMLPRLEYWTERES